MELYGEKDEEEGKVRPLSHVRKIDKLEGGVGKFYMRRPNQLCLILVQSNI